jgi:hypothetical protein
VGVSGQELLLYLDRQRGLGKAWGWSWWAFAVLAKQAMQNEIGYF